MRKSIELGQLKIVPTPGRKNPLPILEEAEIENKLRSVKAKGLQKLLTKKLDKIKEDKEKKNEKDK